MHEIRIACVRGAILHPCNSLCADFLYCYSRRANRVGALFVLLVRFGSARISMWINYYAPFFHLLTNICDAAILLNSANKQTNKQSNETYQRCVQATTFWYTFPIVFHWTVCITIVGHSERKKKHKTFYEYWIIGADFRKFTLRSVCWLFVVVLLLNRLLCRYVYNTSNLAKYVAWKLMKFGMAAETAATHRITKNKHMSSRSIQKK